MNSSAEKIDAVPRALRVWIDDDFICIQLTDGREVKTPLEFYPTLVGATKEQRQNFEVFGQGTAIHWPELDEDLPVEGIVQGRRGIAWKATRTPSGS